MHLSELSQHIPDCRRIGGDVDVQALAYDSRQVTPGTLFVALRGADSDGHDFISQAMSGGAVALAVNADCAGWYAARGVPMLVVPDTRRALPALAAAFYGEPSRALDLIGVTGTNGKTTTSFMIESVLRTWGEKTGLIGTVGALINGKECPFGAHDPGKRRLAAPVLPNARAGRDTGRHGSLVAGHSWRAAPRAARSTRACGPI